MGKLICEICKKQIKEDTEGNFKYCQGHDIFAVTEFKERKEKKSLFETEGQI